MVSICTASAPGWLLYTGCCGGGEKWEEWVGTVGETQIDWWQQQPDAKIFSDMYAYCNLVKKGAASALQVQTCDCGWKKPEQCQKQTKFSLPPVKKEAPSSKCGAYGIEAIGPIISEVKNTAGPCDCEKKCRAIARRSQGALGQSAGLPLGLSHHLPLPHQPPCLITALY